MVNTTNPQLSTFTDLQNLSHIRNNYGTGIGVKTFNRTQTFLPILHMVYGKFQFDMTVQRQYLQKSPSAWQIVQNYRIVTLFTQYLHSIYTLSTQYLHSIYTLSTHYLHSIYIVSTQYKCSPALHGHLILHSPGLLSCKLWSVGSRSAVTAFSPPLTSSLTRCRHPTPSLY